jgi:hypothetical protein
VAGEKRVECVPVRGGNGCFPEREFAITQGGHAPLSANRSATMDAAQQAQFSIAALICSVTALFFSLLAAFPGFKDVLAAVRDGILWFAMFLVLGAAAFVVWHHVEWQAAISGTQSTPATTSQMAPISPASH